MPDEVRFDTPPVPTPSAPRPAPARLPRQRRSSGPALGWDSPNPDEVEGGVTLNPNMNIHIRLAKEKLKLKHVSWMADKLATTQAAGLPTYRALGMLGRMRKNDVLGKRLLELQEKMAEGRSLADGMRDREEEFGPLACALVEAGEASGSLEHTLSKVAELTETRLRLRRKVRSALMYPIAVVVIAVGLITALLTYVVPTFAQVYSEAGGQLPMLTQLILQASEYAPYIGGSLLVAVAAAYGLVRYSGSDPVLRLRLDTWKLKLPLLGPLMEKGVNARIAATLANLLAAGVPLLDALEHSAQVASNLRFGNALREVRTRVSDGETFSTAVEKVGIFPELFVQLSSVGEESGSLPRLMESYAQSAEEEVADAAEAVTSLIEPLMMVVIGGIVGVFLLGLYLPMLDIGSQIK